MLLTNNNENILFSWTAIDANLSRRFMPIANDKRTLSDIFRRDARSEKFIFVGYMLRLMFVSQESDDDSRKFDYKCSDELALQSVHSTTDDTRHPLRFLVVV